MTTYRNAFLIYNPKAGALRRRHERLLNRTLEILRRGGHQITALATTGPNTAQAIVAKCIRDGADVILAAGGDGTINEVANGMIGSRIPLGILPGGTANVLANELGLGRNMLKAAGMVGDCAPARVSVGLLRGTLGEPRHFLLMAGVGLDAHIVYNLNLELKAKLGKVSYWITGFAQLGKPLEEFDVRANGSAIRCSFALASRVRNYGGDLEIAPTACLLDKDFELVLFEGDNATRYVKYLVGVVTRGLSWMKGVSIIRTATIDFRGSPDSRVYVQVDGEFAGRLPARVETVEDALTLLIPPSFRDFKRLKRLNLKTVKK